MGIAEAADSGKALPLAAALSEGVKNISYNQEITFVKYVKVVLPIDGFVFWVKASLLSQSAKLNAAKLNGVALNVSASVLSAAETFTIQGSLHYAIDTLQQETENYDRNRVLFTALKSVEQFNEIGPTIMYLGEFQGNRFSWNSRGNFYKQADLYHYMGDAVYPMMESQIIDDPSQLRARQIVSNSLPIWLSMSNMQPQPWQYFGTSGLTLYPSYLTEPNIPPPYAAVHIPPEMTQSLAATARLGPTLSHDQLVRDMVRITIYGFDNEQVLGFLDFVNQQSLLDNATFGIMNMPVVQDSKQIQTEIGALAMKKTIDFEINYYQSVSRNVARQLIESVVINYQPF